MRITIDWDTIKKWIKQLSVVGGIGLIAGLVYEFIVVIFWGQYTFLDNTFVIWVEFIGALLVINGLLFTLIDMEVND